MSAQVFISYSQKDTAAYSSLCVALDSSGIQRWNVEYLSLGKPLAEGLRNAIEECDVCVFIATTRSLESRWCLAELGAFWGAGKRVMLYMADPEVNEDKLPPQFLGNLWTDDATKLIEDLKTARSKKLQRTSTGYQMMLGKINISTCFGRVEEFDDTDYDCMIALPANEYFDDECINDRKSALGAFVQHYFNDRTEAFQALVRDQLAGQSSTKSEKRPNEFVESYGTGKCIYLGNALGSGLRVALVSVTTQRADAGIRGDVSYIFDAVKSIQQVMANYRIRKLRIPTFGTGHGGLDGEVSLACIIIALSELGRKGIVQQIEEVEIVIFKGHESSPSAIPEASVRRTLDCLIQILST